MLRTRRGAPAVESDPMVVVLTAVAAADTYEARLDAVLRVVALQTGLPSRHLYFSDPGARRLRLERSATIGAAPHDDPEGGAATEVAAPQVELVRDEGAAVQRIVATPAGPHLATLLTAGTREVGALLAGPVEGNGSAAVRATLAALAPAIGFAIDSARREELQRRELADLHARLDAGRRLQGSALDLDSFLRLVLDLARSATAADAAFIAISDPTGRLHPRASTGLPDGFFDGLDLDPTTGIFDWSPAEFGGALLLRDAEPVAARGIRSLLAVPLTEGDRRLGVLALVNITGGRTFDVESIGLLDAFAHQVRLMLGKSQLFDRFVDEYVATLAGLAEALDARRPWTRGHHRAVTAATDAIANRMGLDSSHVAALRLAARIHDVGMAGTPGDGGGWPADIEHTAVAAAMVDHLPVHPAVPTAIATHHEWYDGWGYPNGLRGDQIPIGGRILAVAELAAELAAGDPVRSPYPSAEIIAELQRRAGTQFDPAVVQAAAEVLPGLDLAALVGQPPTEA